MSSSADAREARRIAWIVALGGALLRALALTWRIRTINGEALLSLMEGGKPFIFTCWHGQLLPLMWHHRGRRIAVLISEHRDGEMVARIASSLGFRTVRGSTTRGGERALIALIRDLREGRVVAVTPDGPRGPARRFAPGALVAAQRAGVPILPTAASASRAWRLASWDGFMIPKPFARVTVAYGPPTRVTGTTPREAGSEAERFQRLLDEAVEAANA